MNAIEQAQQAYAPTQVSIRTERSVEAQLLTQVTGRLSKTSANATKNFPDFVAAVYANRQMWITFASSVADKENELPQQLRAQLFYLAEFTEQHTRKVLAKQADIGPLIDINKAVLRGLNGQVPM